METILIATDFSKAAQNAVVYGLELGKFLGAKVAVLHICQPIIAATDTVVVIPQEELMKDCKESLHKHTASLAKDMEIDVEYFVEEGSSVEGIKQFAKKINARWIIVGMRGGGTTFRKIFGSTAISLSKHSNIPVIVVPENARFIAPKSIALASDIDNKTDIHLLDPLEEFGIKFNSTMYVVRVIKKGMDELIERLLRPTRLQWHCRELHPSFQFLSNEDVAHAMNEFVKEHHIDMVAMIAKEHSLFERIFSHSEIKKMLLHTSVPLIILPGKADATYAVQMAANVSHN